MLENKLYYSLNQQNRAFFKGIEEQRKISGISGEEYLSNVLNQFKIPHYRNSNQYCHDDGVDLVIEYKNKIYICQVKYWIDKTINYKMVKQIYGEMKLSKQAKKYQQTYSDIKYILFCPYTSRQVKEIIHNFEEDDFIIISNNRFLNFMLNPIYVLENDFTNSLAKEEILSVY
ncbi:hypothetical protein [Clostridium butyricum]|uniref:hypothetical protein n=1 Tax=Clostridium butyricum TaxID=1492 RepID=UPI00374E2970